MKNNVAPKVNVIKAKRLVLKEKKYQVMKNVMSNVLKVLDMFILPAQILQHARKDLIQSECVMD